MAEDVYRRLAEAFDGFPPGFAATESDLELRLLARFYRPEEAALAGAMLPIPEPAADIAARAGTQLAETRHMLQRMAGAGLIAAKEGGSETQYLLMPFMGGVFEEQVHLLDAETAELFEEYYVVTQGVVPHELPAFHRVIPVEESVPSGIEIYPYERTVEILRAAKSWAVRPCLCRVQQRLVGKGCERPTGNCVIFAPVENAFEEGGADRPISLDEALGLIREAADLGLVHTLPNYRQGYDYVCSCCTCCCLSLRALAEFGVPTAIAQSGFRAYVNSELCEGCGNCVERCQFQALSVPDDVSVVDYNRCVGCGSCVTVCPADALRLERWPEGEAPPPPATPDEWVAQRAPPARQPWSEAESWRDRKELDVTEKTPRSEGFYVPAEWEEHEGTWLQWPHDLHIEGHQMRLEHIWLEMTRVLHQHEVVHIVVTDEQGREHVERQLAYYGLDLGNIDLRVFPTDDVWARDSGPMFMVNDKGELAAGDWNFNGWGERYPFARDTKVPAGVAEMLSVPVFTAPITLEGGGVEVNGKGTLMATLSSIVNPNRNPGKSQAEIEEVLREYLSVDHFIWLSGRDGVGDTDVHIDGAARFTDGSTVLYSWTDDESYPRYDIWAEHKEQLEQAVTESGKPLTLVPLPVTEGRIWKTVRQPVRPPFKNEPSLGLYANYYVANNVVLVPVYGDVNDARAKSIIAEHFPGREVIGILAHMLAELGGMIHCVTQQQPASGFKEL